MKIAVMEYADLSPRAKRNQLLTDSDWTQLWDTRLTDAERTAWADYREHLRSVDLSAPVWPQKPY